MRDIIAITYDGVSLAPELTAAEWRQIDGGLFTRDSTGLVYPGIRGGAVSNTGFAVTITPLTAVVQTTAGLGAYRGVFPAGAAELAKTITAAHATLPRVDALDVRVYDHEADASGLRGMDIVYTAGTAAASPVAPTFTGVGIRLGTFAVPASGGGNPVFTTDPALTGYASAGGVLSVASRPANPIPGLEIFNRSTGIRELYNGTAWRNILGPGWTPWTTDWRAPGGSVAVGTDGSKVAKFRDLGDQVHWKIRILRGTAPNGATVGDGAYTWTLPPAMDVTTYDSDCGTGYYRRAAVPGDNVPLIWATVNTTAIGAWRTFDAQRLAFNTVAWAAGDVIVLTGTHEKTQT
jgi:hypothetical protein